MRPRRPSSPTRSERRSPRSDTSFEARRRSGASARGGHRSSRRRRRGGDPDDRTDPMWSPSKHLWQPIRHGGPRSLRARARSRNPPQCTRGHRPVKQRTTAGNPAVVDAVSRAQASPHEFRTSGDQRADPLPNRWMQWSSFPPPHSCPKAQGQRRQERDRRGEARQVRLHDYSFRLRCAPGPAAGRSCIIADPRSLALRLHLAMDLPWTAMERRTSSSATWTLR